MPHRPYPGGYEGHNIPGQSALLARVGAVATVGNEAQQQCEITPLRVRGIVDQDRSGFADDRSQQRRTPQRRGSTVCAQRVAAERQTAALARQSPRQHRRAVPRVFRPPASAARAEGSP